MVAESYRLSRGQTAAWLDRFRSRLSERRVPATGVLELTSRCNLRCVHCYLGPQEDQARKRDQEMDTGEVLAVIDEMVAAGCIGLIITGGDPMMRRDFAVVYRHAKESGLIVTVYCDGILVTDAILDLFAELPPRKVEVSLYGATAETYEAVTRVSGSHAHAWQGIHRLLDAGVRVALKTVMLTVNANEIGDMRAQAHALGLPFRFDAAIFPCVPEGARETTDPTAYRVAPEQVVAEEMADPKTRDGWVQRLTVDGGSSAPSKTLYNCGAGATAFYVDPFANLSPCIMTPQYTYSLRDNSLQGIWDDEIAAMRAKPRTRSAGCSSAGATSMCTGCAALNYLETGDEETDSAYMRETTRLRHEAVLAAINEQEDMIHE